MYKFLSKNGQVIAFGIGVVITAIFLILIFSGLEGFNALPEDDRITSDIFNFGIYAVIALIILCAIFAILFGIFQVVTNPKGSVKGLIGIAALAAVFFIAYSMATMPAPDTALAATKEGFEVTDGQFKFISGEILSALVLAGVAAASFVIAEIINFFK